MDTITDTPVTDAYLRRKHEEQGIATFPDDEAFMRALEAKLATARKALRFILDECDWEEGGHPSTYGDSRIGPACEQALSDSDPLKES